MFIEKNFLIIYNLLYIKEDFMEKVKNIFGAFFDVNSFSIKKIIIAILFLFVFFLQLYHRLMENNYQVI